MRKSSARSLQSEDCSVNLIRNREASGPATAEVPFVCFELFKFALRPSLLLLSPSPHCHIECLCLHRIFVSALVVGLSRRHAMRLITASGSNQATAPPSGDPLGRRSIPHPRLCRKTETLSLSSSDPLGPGSIQLIPSVDPLGPWSIHSLLGRAQRASLLRTLL